ncbi:MAG TPA: tyrosine-type recombinase/integrase [Blastocatellia bacterium]
MPEKKKRKRPGYYVERNGKIYARVTYTDEAGKRRQVWRRADSKSNAKDIANDLIRELDEFGDTVLTSDQMTLSQYLDQWLQTAAKPRVSERTFSDYQDLLIRYVRPALGRRVLSQVKPLNIQALYTDMQERGLSARTVRYTHAILTSALKQAVKWRMLTHNPAQLVDLPKLQRKEMKALTKEEAEKFLSAASEDRYGVLFAIALATGMRPEEYLALQWKDVDLERETVSVKRTLCWRRLGGGWYFGEPKTVRSRRQIPLSPYLVHVLVEHKRRQAEERMKAGPQYQNFDLIFATAQGGPVLLSNLFRRHFKPLLRHAGLDNSIRLYDLRHSCATLLLEANVNPKVVSERLGHASITLTMDTYSHVLPSMQQAASEKIENILFAPMLNTGRK